MMTTKLIGLVASCSSLCMCTTIADIAFAMKGGFALKLPLLGQIKKKFLTTPNHQSMSRNSDAYVPQVQLSGLAKHSNRTSNHTRKTLKACSPRAIWKP